MKPNLACKTLDSIGLLEVNQVVVLEVNQVFRDF